MAIKILLLEDDPNLGLIVQEHLQHNEYDVALAVNGKDGLEMYKRGSYDLCLVDIMMPAMDGFTFVEEVRKTDDNTPLIFLTAKSLKEDKIRGFKAGCDDYVTKPFSIEELLLRVRAVLKRVRREEGESSLTKFKIGSFEFDSRKQILKSEGAEFNLTARESELLRILCLSKNKTVERNEVLNKIWGDESYFSGRSMDVFISKLRKYLKSDSRIDIKNIRGRGYKLVVSK
jgi:DNA-binding response OmpR family regulator